MDERAANLLNNALSFGKQGKWMEADCKVQEFYATLPKDPALIAR